MVKAHVKKVTMMVLKEDREDNGSGSRERKWVKFGLIGFNDYKCWRSLCYRRRGWKWVRFMEVVVLIDMMEKISSFV